MDEKVDILIIHEVGVSVTYFLITIRNSNNSLVLQQSFLVVTVFLRQMFQPVSSEISKLMPATFTSRRHT